MHIVMQLNAAAPTPGKTCLEVFILEEKKNEIQHDFDMEFDVGFLMQSKININYLHHVILYKLLG